MSPPSEETPAEASIVAALQATGEVGHDLLAVDWSAVPIGAPEDWPGALKTAVRILLTSRFSMWMAWGSELTFFCNDAYRRDTLGTKYPWALGRPAREVWAEIWPDIGPRIESVLRTGQATWDESLLLFLERSGYVEETYHTFSYSPLSDDSGAIVGMLCVVSEDTERVIGERRIATLRDLGSVPLVGHDERAYLLAASRHLAANDRSLPFSMVYLFDEHGGAELACAAGIDAGHPAAPVRILAGEEAVWPVAELAAGRRVVEEHVNRRFDQLPTGAWREPPTSAVALPLLQAGLDAQPYGFLVVGVNRYRPLDQAYLAFLELVAAQLASGVAGARSYDAERRRAEELAALDRAKTAFFTNISHELRTPLTLLLGPAEDALSEQTLNEADRRRMELIARNGNRLLRLVNTLLDFSRLQSGRIAATFEPVELGRYTSELAEQFAPAVERAGLSFELDCQSLPAPVYVDREMWAKIVLNLLSNALKFTFAGSIGVRVEESEGSARLAVSDTGIGIDPMEQGRLFERFHRVRGARGRTHEGSGIGLALVAELTALHHGRVAVESAPGVGSVFTVELPFGSEHLPADQINEHPSELAVESQAAGVLDEVNRWLAPDRNDAAAAKRDGRARPRVLVVDDNADMRDYVAGLLSEDYEVQSAVDGEQALELARAQPPDLVLTDVMMPRLDGFGLLNALRADPTTMPIPVVMLSARAGEEGVVEGLEGGADDYVIKPFSARELRARVGANLELDRARRVRDQLQASRLLQDQAERLAEVGSWEINVSSGLMRASQQVLRLLRLSQSEFDALPYGEAIARLVHPDDARTVETTLASAIATGDPFEYEVRLLHENGDERWVRVRGEVHHDESGKAATVSGFIQDVTQRREAEQALAAAAAASEAAVREHQLAADLQRSLLPDTSFESPYLTVATYYQAGVEGTLAGGDWYDAIDLGAGRTALVIGDVAGRGVLAAGLMGQLRAAVRACARVDLTPADVLELLDTTVAELASGQLVTCIYGVHDPQERTFLYANAGHLPPVLAIPEQPARRLRDQPNPPLGFGSGRYNEHCVALPPGALLALYTDGLVERRDEDLDQRIDDLASFLRAEEVDLAGIPAQLLSALNSGDSGDDIAILLARAVEVTEQVAQLEVPALASAVQVGRKFTATTMRDWSVSDDLLPDATLIVSELLTNAVMYGTPPIRLRLRRGPKELAVEVDDGSSAMPRKLRPAVDDLHGRGLAIMAELATRWGARPRTHGKTVWSTLQLPD